MQSSVESQLNKILSRYPDKVNEIVEAEAQQVANATAQRLRSTSPKKSGKYARSWQVKRLTEGQIKGYVVYNTEGQLTHLLENGHLSRNQYGSYGRVAGITHIKPAATQGEMQYEQRLRQKIGMIQI